MPTAPLLERPLRSRLVIGAGLGFGFGLLAILIAIQAAVGGRYQFRGSTDETDMWALAALYPIGTVLAGVIGALLGPLWRNRWSAGIAAAVVAVPVIALISISHNPHGSRPYHVEWGAVIVVPLLFGVIMPFVYPTAVRRGQAYAATATKRRRSAG